MIPNINLLPKTDKRKAESNLVYILIGVIVLLALAFMLWQYFSARSSLADFTTEEATLQQEVEKLQTDYDNLITLQNRGSLEKSVTFVERVSYPVSPLIDETQDLLSANTYLRSYSFSESAVSINVDFETLGNIAQYVSALENSKYFSDAQLSNVSNFEVKPEVSSEEEEDETEKFNEVPRYSTSIMLEINQTYLATGGVQ
jgi:Tfp pilus assembly protein PilN